jgi:exosome complex exonuclease DIS3/RRP44
MLVSKKSFFKKTKRGAVIKIVREHYLRSDLACGLPGCPICIGQTSNLTEPRSIDGFPQHYMIPDTNILYHQVKEHLI